MEFKLRHFAIEQSNDVYKISTDTLLLAAFVKKHTQEVISSVLDVGTGTGAIAFILAEHFKKADIHAIDVNKDAINLCQKNAKKNSLINNFHFHCTDFNEFKTETKFDLIVSNPPFFKNSVQHKSEHMNLARHEVSLGIEKLIEGMGSLISENGVAWVILPYDRLRELLTYIEYNHFYLAYKIIVLGKPSTPKRIIVGLTKTEQPKIEDVFTIRTKEGKYSKEYIHLTKDIHCEGVFN